MYFLNPCNHKIQFTTRGFVGWPLYLSSLTMESSILPLEFPFSSHPFRFNEDYNTYWLWLAIQRLHLRRVKPLTFWAVTKVNVVHHPTWSPLVHSTNVYWASAMCWHSLDTGAVARSEHVSSRIEDISLRKSSHQIRAETRVRKSAGSISVSS